MNLLRLLFSFKGSICRWDYLLAMFIAFLLYTLLVYIFPLAQCSAAHPSRFCLTQWLTAFSCYAGRILPVIIYLVGGLKLLRDIGCSNWFIILFCIPFLDLSMILVGLFIPKLSEKSRPCTFHPTL